MLAALPVRPGYARYGADCFFDAETWRVLRIERREAVGEAASRAGPSGSTRLGPHQLATRTYYPYPTGDAAAWSYAKFCFRSSVFTLVTVVDHLYELHLALSTVAGIAVREQLSAAHPLRRFLTPFFQQTFTVNDRAYDLLVAERTMASRTLAFTAEGLQEAWEAAPSLVCTRAMRPGGADELIDQPPIEQLLRLVDRERYLHARAQGGVDTPYERQSLELYRAFKRYVHASLRAIHPSANGLAADAELVGFVEQLLRTLSTTSHLVARADVAAASGLGADEAAVVVVVSALAPEVLEELCTCLIATVCDRVTAGHEQVGHLAPYAKDGRFCAWRWPVGEACSNKQSAITQAVLTSFTFMPMPRLLAAPGSDDDWSHVFAGCASEEALRHCYAAFQRDLSALAASFDEYNAAATTRPFPHGWGLWTNHPQLLECSLNL